MSSYEFWDELGKIFNAVVAYQEKNIEFNKRFISPWIRLGNVFEKQDRNKEAVDAYERAIELDANNPQNWFELGNIHFKMDNHGEAIGAFQRALELDGEFGLAYSNLALSLVSTGETERAVELYQKAIGLLEDPKDKAVAWNRLGNAYRKLNQYEQALEAFHKADELDQENSGFRDSMDDVTSGPEIEQAERSEPADSSPTMSSIGLIVADNRAEEQAEEAAQAGAETEESEGVSVGNSGETGAQDTTAGPPDSTPVDVPELDTAVVAMQEPESESVEDDPEPQPLESQEAAMEAASGAGTDAVATQEEESEAAESAAGPDAVESVEAAAESEDDERADSVEGQEESLETAQPTGVPEETVTVVVQDSAETFTETLPIADANWKPSEAEKLIEEEALGSPKADQADQAETPSTEEPEAEPDSASELKTSPAMATEEAAPEAENEVQAPDVDPAPNSMADQLLKAEPEVLEIPQHVAYEEYLKDTNEPIQEFENDDSEAAETPGSPEPVSKIDEAGDLQIEMDTKNAHVWNELGNVYYNSQAFDDAIVAYSKAIELDRWFAWPYSNLALAYVQKRRFVEAILLYQRSIELFSNDKDKAISWNRLGNVYRRLNDYENAIASYQRADALDPDNSTLSLQSRFSLLGSYAAEQKPSYVS